MLDIARLLETVADYQPIRRVNRHPHRRQQLRFRAHLETEPEISTDSLHLTHQMTVLIDLDRVDAGVAALIGRLLDGGSERVREIPHPLLEEVWKSDRHRGFYPAFGKTDNDVVEINHLFRVAPRHDGEVPYVGYGEKALAPVVNTVQLSGSRNRPAVGSRSGIPFRAGLVNAYASRCWSFNHLRKDLPFSRKVQPTYAAEVVSSGRHRSVSATR